MGMRLRVRAWLRLRLRLSARVRRTLLAVIVMAAVVVPVSAAAHPTVPAPPPATLAPLTVSTLPTAYEANRANAARAARMAAAHGDERRARTLRGMATPGRRFLAFDARGPGRTAEVFGDLATADRVTVLVPGSDTSLDSYRRLRAGALALHGELGARVAVIAWLGYETPDTVSPSAVTTGRADEAAPELSAFVRQLRTLRPAAPVSLLCHSYGSVVCARAARGLDVADIAFFGSPGTGADSVAALGTRARVWAGRGADDWIAGVPHTSVGLFGTTVGFGADPTAPAFGARRFAAGAGGHSDYLAPGSASLTNLARIALGEPSEVTHA